MKFLKKRIAILLSVLMLLSVISVSASADDAFSLLNDDPPINTSLVNKNYFPAIVTEGEDGEGEENPPVDPPIDPPVDPPVDPEEPPVEPPEYAPDTVALLYLCTNWTGFPSLGHIWIYIENVSDETLTVGIYDLPAGEGVSVGTFGLTRSDGFGIYYNIEAYTGNLLGMDDSFSIKTEMNRSEFNKVSAKIARSNFWDPIIFNCAFFAITCWNLGGGSFMLPVVVFPIFARLQMKFRDYEVGIKMFYPDITRVHKQKGFGSSAYLDSVDPGSLDTPPG